MSRRFTLFLRSLCSLAPLLLPLSCGGAEGGDLVPYPLDPLDPLSSPSSALAQAPSRDCATLSVGEWNIEWFGSPGHGPADKALQRRNAEEVIRDADLELWGLEEIVDTGDFDELVSDLPGYAGFLANDPIVEGGSEYYTEGKQKVGILYQSDAATVHSAEVILGDHAYDFGGRPPLEVHLKVGTGKSTSDLVLIVLHAKAMADPRSYDRRQQAAASLKTYLDSTHPTDKVLVVGDFNDDVDTSITPGKPTPYSYFVDDAADYTFVTEPLSEAGETSTVHYREMINHHLVTNELEDCYVKGSAAVIRPDRQIASYPETTSDHYPTVSRYWLGDDRAIAASRKNCSSTAR